MKRYTLSFKLLDDAVTTEALESEVEELLLRLHPHLTYKMGQVITALGGSMDAWIAMDGKVKQLKQALSAKEWKIPVKYESMSWGWLMYNEEATSLVETVTSFDKDPLAAIQPLDGSGAFQLNRRRLWMRYLILVTSTIVLIVLLVANILHNYTPWLEWLYVFVFFIWMLALNETPIDFRIYTREIRFGPDGLEVRFWYPHKVINLGWDKITGLVYTHPVCQVLGQGQKLRFMLSERFGCPDKPVVLKTIIARANLHYVQGNITSVIYRRGDA